jgi:aspartyl-tRNA synthetase
MPVEEDIDKFTDAPLEMRAKAYDIVLNGVELGSGSIRIHSPKIQQQMFEALGMTQDTIDARFGFLMDAFEYGVPPHGGFAFGLDRLLMLLSGSASIREVIPFPKMRDGSCAMTDSPSAVDPEQLEELSIRLMTQTQESPKVEKESLERIDYVANLARIELTEKERKSFSRDLTDIIAFADQLNSLDLSGYEPLTHVVTGSHSRRKDKWVKSTDVESLLKNAPSKTENYIHVPRTVEKEGEVS